jgi:hypothetical protein
VLRNQFTLGADATLLALRDGVSIDSSHYDAEVVVHAGTGHILYFGNAIGWSPAVSASSRATLPLAVLPEHERFDTWAHEFGHMTGMLTTPERTALPDLYRMGNVGDYGATALDATIPANGSFDVMGGRIIGVTDSHPSNFSIFSKEMLQLLVEDRHAKTDVGLHWIAESDAQQLGDPAFRFDVTNNGAVGNQYWLIEARDKSKSVWDENLPTTAGPHLVVYNVDTFGNTHGMYGWSTAGVMNANYWAVGIPLQNAVLGSPERGVLGVGDTYHDLNHLVSISAAAQENRNGKPGITADIEAIDGNSLGAKYLGSILLPDKSLQRVILDRTSGTLAQAQRGYVRTEMATVSSSSPWKAGVVASLGLLLLCLLAFVFRNPLRLSAVLLNVLVAIAVLSTVWFGYTYIKMRSELTGSSPGMPQVAPREAPAAPDTLNDEENIATPGLDLHVYCPDGRHVGMNYQTNQYENQITGAITNGKNAGMPSWIFFPATPENDGCKHTVSAHDNAAFLAANPDIAAQLTDTADKYDIYARYIDPTSGIHTSTTLTNQTIQPGESIVHEVTGTSVVTLTAGVPDITAPVTTFSASGAAGTNAWYTGPITVTLSATDGQDGTGVQGTTYSLDGGLTWTAYATPFVITDDGEHAVLFGSTDNAGNVEITRNQVIRIDATVPAATIVTPAASALIASHSVDVTGTIVEYGSGVGVVTANGAPCVLAEPTHLAFTCQGVPVEEGSAVITVTATDLAGNTADASVTILVDIIAPDTAIDSAPSGAVPSTDAFITFHSTEAGSTFMCSLDGSTPVTCVNPITYHSLSDGAHTFSVTATDAVGNVDATPATAAWSVDTTAPDTIIDSAPSGTVNIASASITFHSTEAGSSFVCSLDGAAVVSCTSPASYTGLADGAHTFSVTATDAVGNTDATPATASWTVDSVAPDTIIDSAPTGTVSATSATFNFHSTEASSTFLCTLDGSVNTPCTSPATHTALTDGPHTFSVTAADPAGNTDATPAIAAWTKTTPVTDTDADGVPNSSDACPGTPGPAIWQGCPSAILATFDRHTVQTGSHPGSTKASVVGATAKAFRTTSGSCASGIGSGPQNYASIYSTCSADGTAVTDASGLAKVGVLPGEYIVIGVDPVTSTLSGVNSGLLASGQSASKYLQVIVRPDGSAVPGKTTTYYGTVLDVIEPEYVEWNSTQEYYPFIFDSQGDWGVTVTVTPPEGFTADNASLSTDVDSEYEALQFTLTDVGSCWECGTDAAITITHKGKTYHQTHNIQSPMTEALVKSKGLKVQDLEAQGVRVTRKGQGNGNVPSGNQNGKKTSFAPSALHEGSTAPRATPMTALRITEAIRMVADVRDERSLALR